MRGMGRLMVSEANLEALRRQGHGYLVGLKRRRNRQVDRWLQLVREEAWVDCPGGINAQESRNRPRTRVQEVAGGAGLERVFVIESEERRAYEQAQREKSMERTRQKLEALVKRVESGRLTDPQQVGAAAERALRGHHGWRYYNWRYQEGRFEFFECRRSCVWRASTSWSPARKTSSPWTRWPTTSNCATWNAASGS